MKVLIACEESQAVTIQFRKMGHEAFSCDIQECSGGHPEWHYQDDLFTVFESEHWDMVIAFPPCTHLSTSGAKHFEGKRLDGRQRESIEFFCKVLNLDCDKLVVENPVNIISGKYIQEHFPDLCEEYNLPVKPTQRIQPYEHGDQAQKTTCLWIKGLPVITPTDIVGKGEFVTTPSGKKLPKWYSDNKSGKARSKTFPGIARAMAEQWGGWL
tara:strand:- start:3967 stop:4602 length:636 start_codon:yes stop_codon:yes gene_type:complete